jgi:NAD(P)-dependent dehydrogenase (short-subunit alcohol dehydrogenase family)
MNLDGEPSTGLDLTKERMMELGLEGKGVLLTGAGSGMGQAMAVSFAEHGANVFAVDRNAEGLDETVALGAGRSGTIAPYVADLAVREQTEDLVDAALARFGRLDVLINNAGIMDRFQAVDELDDEVWERNLAINTDAPMRLMRKAARAMLPQGSGVIINVISMSAVSGASAGVAYTASKHALMGLTRATAWAYAERGIRVNAILPGATATNIAQSIGTDFSPVGQARSARFQALYPVRMTPQDMADIALFLASDRAIRINGAEISADGGWCAC